jgi:hypothetical protein
MELAQMQITMSIEFAPVRELAQTFVKARPEYDRARDVPMFIGFAPVIGLAQTLAQTGATGRAPVRSPFRGSD